MNIDKKEVLSKIRTAVISTSKFNQIFAEESIPHREWNDLTIYYRLVDDVSVEFSAAVITGKNAEDLGLSEDDLFKLSILNDEGHIMMEPLVDVINPGAEDETGLILVSRKSMYYGAGVLVNPNILDMLKESYGEGKYYMLPSSIHEILFIKDNKHLNPDILNKKVRIINATEVDPKDVLSDHVYIFDTEAGIKAA